MGKYAETQKEMAIPYKITGKDIRGAWQFECDGSISNPANRKIGKYIPNPDYVAPCATATQVLKNIGRGVTAVGVIMDGENLYLAYQQGQRANDLNGFANEVTRVAGGWSGAISLGSVCARTGAIACAPFGPLSSLIGGTLAGAAGSVGGYFGGGIAAGKLKNLITKMIEENGHAIRKHIEMSKNMIPSLVLGQPIWNAVREVSKASREKNIMPEQPNQIDAPPFLEINTPIEQYSSSSATFVSEKTIKMPEEKPIPSIIQTPNPIYYHEPATKKTINYGTFKTIAEYMDNGVFIGVKWTPPRTLFEFKAGGYFDAQGSEEFIRKIVGRLFAREKNGEITIYGDKYKYIRTINNNSATFIIHDENGKAKEINCDLHFFGKLWKSTVGNICTGIGNWFKSKDNQKKYYYDDEWRTKEMNEVLWEALQPQVQKNYEQHLSNLESHANAALASKNFSLAYLCVKNFLDKRQEHPYTHHIFENWNKYIFGCEFADLIDKVNTAESRTQKEAYVRDFENKYSQRPGLSEDLESLRQYILSIEESQEIQKLNSDVNQTVIDDEQCPDVIIEEISHQPEDDLNQMNQTVEKGQLEHLDKYEKIAHCHSRDELEALRLDLNYQMLISTIDERLQLVQQLEEQNLQNKLEFYKKFSDIEAYTMCGLTLFKDKINPTLLKYANQIYSTKDFRDFAVKRYLTGNWDWSRAGYFGLSVINGVLSEPINQITTPTLMLVPGVINAAPKAIEYWRGGECVQSIFEFADVAQYAAFYFGQRYFKDCYAQGKAPESFWEVAVEKYINNPLLHSLCVVPTILAPTPLTMGLAISGVSSLLFLTPESQEKNKIHNQLVPIAQDLQKLHPEEYSQLLDKVEVLAAKYVSSEEINQFKKRLDYLSSTYQSVRESNKHLVFFGVTGISQDKKNLKSLLCEQFIQGIMYFEGKWGDKNIQNELEQLQISLDKAIVPYRLQQLKNSLQTMLFDFNEMSKMARQLACILNEERNVEAALRQLEVQDLPPLLIDEVRKQGDSINRFVDSHEHYIYQLKNIEYQLHRVRGPMNRPIQSERLSPKTKLESKNQGLVDLITRQVCFESALNPQKLLDEVNQRLAFCHQQNKLMSTWEFQTKLVIKALLAIPVSLFGRVMHPMQRQSFVNRYSFYNMSMQHLEHQRGNNIQHSLP